MRARAHYAEENQNEEIHLRHNAHYRNVIHSNRLLRAVRGLLHGVWISFNLRWHAFILQRTGKRRMGGCVGRFFTSKATKQMRALGNAYGYCMLFFSEDI